MPDTPRKEKHKDTTLYRTEGNVGFNARVEPMWHTFVRLRSKRGFFENWREKRRMKNLIRKIDEKFGELRVAANGWDQAGGECVCNLRVAKMGLTAELKTHLEAAVGKETSAAWKHLASQRDSRAVALPLDFPEPFTVPLGRGSDNVLVTSSVRLAAELAEVNRKLRIEETFALARMSKIDYIDASQRDISVYESKFASMNDFWPKFAYVLLKKLADKSVESKLPVHFA